VSLGAGLDILGTKDIVTLGRITPLCPSWTGIIFRIKTMLLSLSLSLSLSVLRELHV
jgi:hypothetical protein